MTFFYRFGAGVLLYAGIILIISICVSNPEPETWKAVTGFVVAIIYFIGAFTVNAMGDKK